MIRERQLGSIAFSSGNVTRLELPKDAVYHWLTFSAFQGTFATVQGAMGTGPTLVPGFPFTLMRDIRLIRNGSDVVFQGSGEQLAKEHFYLNKAHPQARLYTVTANVETLRVVTTRGQVVPANSEGLGANTGGYAVPDAPAGTGTVLFDFQVDLWLQINPDDAYFATILDARKLGSFVIEILWATEAAQIAVAGTANTSSAASFSMNVLSVDQDNLDVENKFGTFKRSAFSISNIPYGSNNQQIQLSRGNFYHGIQIGTKAFKAGSTANAIAENSVISTIDNQINTNFSARRRDFRQLQANNIADMNRQQAYGNAEGCPQGYAYLSYYNVGHKAAEMVPSYTMDTYTLLLNTQALASSTNGVTTAATSPQIEFLIEEVIPGVSMSSRMPQGAQAGSISGTSAKPYSR